MLSSSDQWVGVGKEKPAELGHERGRGGAPGAELGSGLKAGRPGRGSWSQGSGSGEMLRFLKERSRVGRADLRPCASGAQAQLGRKTQSRGWGWGIWGRGTKARSWGPVPTSHMLSQHQHHPVQGQGSAFLTQI